MEKLRRLFLQSIDYDEELVSITLKFQQDPEYKERCYAKLFKSTAPGKSSRQTRESHREILLETYHNNL